MTTQTIPLAAMTGDAGDNLRRDQWGRLLVVPQTGGDPIGYTRVTTVAKALDSEGGLGPWKATMAACGLIMRRGLRAQWEALLAEHGDPWYASEEAKARCKRLVEDCAAVGGANDRKEVGSALHTITALVDLGRTPTHLTEETERDIEAYTAGLATAGVRFVPGHVELTVVLDEWGVAGTFDRLAIVPGFTLPLVADLKTGSNLAYSWHPFAVQLSAYSRANALYRQGPEKDGSADERLPMPEVDQNWGLIMWLDVKAGGSASLELYLVDLQAGWEAFEHSMWTRGWRNRRDVGTPLEELRTDSGITAPGGDLTELLEASVRQVEQSKAEHPSVTSILARQRDWLQGRINEIGQHPAARADLGARWPADVPTLRASNEHTPEQIAVIEKLLDDVETAHRLQFPPDRPDANGEQDLEHLLRLFPNATVTDKEPSP
jgi:hypothetical protein